jgi:hypothetical protein
MWPLDPLSLFKKKLNGDEAGINEDTAFDAIFANLCLHGNEPDSQ